MPRRMRHGGGWRLWFGKWSFASQRAELLFEVQNFGRLALLRILSAIEIQELIRRRMMLLLRIVLVGKIGNANPVRGERLLKLRPLRVQSVKIPAFTASLSVNRSVASNRNIERKLRA